jgi:hypothetical protein
MQQAFLLTVKSGFVRLRRRCDDADSNHVAWSVQERRNLEWVSETGLIFHHVITMRSLDQALLSYGGQSWSR